MRRISLRFTISVFLPLILAFGLTIFVITYNLNTQVMNESYKVADQKLELASSELSTLVGTVRTLHGNMCRDERLKNLMYQQRGGGLTPSMRQSFADICSAYRTRNTSLLRSIMPLALDGAILDNIYAQFDIDDLTDRDAFDIFVDNYYYSMLIADEDSSRDDKTLTYFGSYFDMNSFERLGYLVISIRANRFFMGLPNMFDTQFSQIFVLDGNDNPVYQFPDEASISTLPHNANEIAGKLDNRLLINGRTFLVYRKTIEAYPAWNILALLDYEDMARETSKTSSLVVGIFILTACVLFAICFIVARKITNPIRRMNAAMLQMSEGVWPEPLESKTADEMHSLITRFNEMSASVQNLTESRITEQREKRLIETSMLESRLAMLQSQINPHFIHNTLNTMKYMALKEQNTELYETIVDFNSLLRASINNISSFATVSEELEYLRSYVNIFNRRYVDEPVAFHSYADPEASDALLPRLILQPLVENALFHGILPTRRAGRIDVVILVQDSYLSTTISDNGCGIDAEIMEKLLNGTYENSRGYNRIGLRNVIDRIHLHYPDTSRFYTSSQTGLGTLIKFDIPYTTEGETSCTLL